jgi:hypothetical protein
MEASGKHGSEKTSAALAGPALKANKIFPFWEKMGMVALSRDGGPGKAGRESGISRDLGLSALNWQTETPAT